MIGVSLDASPVYLITEFMAKVSEFLRVWSRCRVHGGCGHLTNDLLAGFTGGLLAVERQSSHLQAKSAGLCQTRL